MTHNNHDTHHDDELFGIIEELQAAEETITTPVSYTHLTLPTTPYV